MGFEAQFLIYHSKLQMGFSFKLDILKAKGKYQNILSVLEINGGNSGKMIN
jgi:hypothetical protein